MAAVGWDDMSKSKTQDIIKRGLEIVILPEVKNPGHLLIKRVNDSLNLTCLIQPLSMDEEKDLYFRHGVSDIFQLSWSHPGLPR